MIIATACPHCKKVVSVHITARMGKSSSKTLMGSHLSKREQEILIRTAYGWSRQRIADDLFIAVSTVKSASRSARKKLGARTTAQAATIAIREGLIA